jgi:Domain of unknown function (DUF4412)
MKLARLSLLLNICLLLSARGDLTIVNKVEGMGPASEKAIKIKGDMARIDATPQMTIISNRKTGEVISLLKEQKIVVRMSGEQMRAATAMMGKSTGDNKTAAKPSFTRTGKKETINGYEAEEYVCETPLFKGSYWIAPKYPGGDAVLKQLQAIKSEVWNTSNMNLPDYHDLPGLPVKSVVSFNGMQITSTLVSVNQNPINDAEFVVPADFRDAPMFGRGKPAEPKKP